MMGINIYIIHIYIYLSTIHIPYGPGMGISEDSHRNGPLSWNGLLRGTPMTMDTPMTGSQVKLPIYICIYVYIYIQRLHWIYIYIYVCIYI